MNRLFFLLIMLGCLLLLGSSWASADVYKYLNPSGQIHLTDQPMPEPYQLLKIFRTPKPRSSRWLEFNHRKARYSSLIDRAAEANGLEPELVHAVVRAESAYQEDAISHAGAIGLMQLMPQTAKTLGVDDPFDPVQNVHGGALYLRILLARFNDDLRLALAAYNAGESAVIKYGYQIPPYNETQRYVVKVMDFYNENLLSGG